MERICDVSFAKRVKTGTSIPIEFSVWAISEICKGLEYAHSKTDALTGKPLARHHPSGYLTSEHHVFL